MNKLKIRLDFGSVSHDVGDLFLSEKLGRYAFGYAPSFLSAGLEIEFQERRQKVLEPEQQRRGRGRKSCRVSLDLLAAI